MAIDTDRLKKLKADADSIKEENWEQYEQAMKYSMPNESTNPDEVSIQKAEGIYDSTAMIENSKLARKQVNMILPTSVQWGGLKTDLKQDASQDERDRLSLYGNNVYRVLVNSNLNKEAMGFFLNLGIGTACMKMVYTGDLSKPVSFTNIPLRSISFLEGGNGEAKYIFHEMKQMRFDQIEDLYPEGNLGGLDIENKYDIIESVFPSETEGMWTYLVTDSTFENVIVEEELVYNPFVVCRALKTVGNPWGTGCVLNVLPNIVNLNNAKYLKRVAGKLGIKPPMAFEGQADHMAKVSLDLGTMFYLGQRGQNSITPLNLQGNINAELMNIDDDIQQIREGMFSSYINGNLDSTQPRTAFEWKKRYDDFLEVFSANYNMIQEEFLIPIFMNTLNILVEIAFQEMDKQLLEDEEISPVFYNKLTENYKSGLIEDMNAYLTNLMQILGTPQAVLGVINLKELVTKFGDWYDIDGTILKEEGEIEQFMEQYLQMMFQQGQGEGA